MLRKILRYQFWHLLILAGLLAAAVTVFRADPDALSGELFSAGTGFWFTVAIAVPVIHHLYVLLAWRLELHGRILSSRFGMERAFRLYSIGFMLLFNARPVSLILLGLSDRGSLDVQPAVAFSIAAVIFAAAGYVLYSVIRFFSVQRAMGLDHFVPDFDRPLVRRGIYRFMSNGMYILGLTFLYLPGLLLFSRAALLAAFFSHLYIWVHYFTVERPDMQLIYGSAEGAGNDVETGET